MQKFSIGIFVSGEGSTLRCVNEAIKNNILQINISFVVINRENIPTDPLINYCHQNGINVLCYPYSFKHDNRNTYLENLYNHLNSYNSDMYLFLGWNIIINNDFIVNSPPILNLHPALPNTFIGNDCIKKAFNAYKQGKIQYTGSMIHRVIEDVDKGEVLDSIIVNIMKDDTLDSLTQKVKKYEKGLVVSVLQNEIQKYNNRLLDNTSDIYIGKVRTVKNLGYNYLLLSASDRLSSFDKHICNIKNKGNVLNYLSTWWFKNTSHIINNHLLYSNGNHMIVKKTRPIKLEIVVRGYMTGSTDTSIWPMYKNGNRNMYGLTFRDGYKKNEPLDEIIITPTTKGLKDHPITETEIIEEGYLTLYQYNFIKKTALELFKYGQIISREKGLLLVDTKYEFGFYGDEIILIDEIHTCDSSRYWKLNSYNDRMKDGLEPEKFDKDCIRDYVKSKCNPYIDKIPEIPDELKERVSNVYNSYYELFDNLDYENNNLSEYTMERVFFDKMIDKRVIIFAGSESDRNHCNKIQNHLKQLNIYSEVYYCSAHKKTKELLTILDKYEKYNKNNSKLCYITVAGLSNALSGVVACNTRFPVIACPPFSDRIDMFTNINSTLQCPSKVPVMTILNPINVALSVKKIFNLI